jgi:hypothetical protein
MAQYCLIPGALVHTVLVSFHKHVSEAQREKMIAEYQQLGEMCGGETEGILFWRAGLNLDQRKNWNMMEFAIFRDNKALQRFRFHPAHVKLGEMMRHLGDWAVGDIEIQRKGSYPA